MQYSTGWPCVQVISKHCITRWMRPTCDACPNDYHICCFVLSKCRIAWSLQAHMDRIAQMRHSMSLCRGCIPAFSTLCVSRRYAPSSIERIPPYPSPFMIVTRPVWKHAALPDQPGAKRSWQGQVRSQLLWWSQTSVQLQILVLYSSDAVHFQWMKRRAVSAVATTAIYVK